MARPVKRRRVCGLPPVGAFRPEGGPGGPVIEVTVDEYEAVRLIDLLGLTQEECAAQMNVARTTVQAIYDSAGEAGPHAGGGQAPGSPGGHLRPVRSGGALLRPALPPPGRGRGPVRKRPPDLPGGGPLPGTVWSGTEQDETGGTEHENSSDI